MRIAVIGSGISGLTAAYLLHKRHDVHVFEKETWIGGHTHTLDIPEGERTLAIDTGFIVFNNKTYPNFNRLIKKLNVHKKKTQMSFSVRNQFTDLEYNGTNLQGLFAQKKNLFNLSYLKMLASIRKLNTVAKKIAQTKTPLTLEQFIQQYHISHYMIDNYLIPMCCAIWSCKKEKMLQTPIQFLFSFLNNHGMLNINDRPQWFVIKNGSSEYVKSLKMNQFIHYYQQEAVLSVSRHSKEMEVITSKKKLKFDKVIFATHANDTLPLLTNPTLLEKEVLSSFTYQDNEVTLHTDTAVLPKNHNAWACWNYLIDKKSSQQCRLSYNMNLLQGLNSQRTYCVSINQNDLIDPQKIIEQFNYSHPVYTQNAFNAQKKHLSISGKENIFYCGAYWGYGFHEDGVNSALHIAKALNGESL